MSDVLLVMGSYCSVFCLMMSVVMCLGRGRVFAVGVMSFYGIGMFLGGGLVKKGWSALFSTLIVLAMSIVLSVLHKPFFSRKDGDDFIVVNLMFLEVVRQVAVHFQGNEGLTGIPRPLGSSWLLLSFTFLITFIVALLFFRLGIGEWHRRWQALAEGKPELVESGGLEPNYLRTFAFMTGSCIAAMAGVIDMWMLGGTDPARLMLSVTVMVFAFAFVGGMSLLGAIVGAAIYVFPPLLVEELFHGTSGVDAAHWRMMIIGLILVFSVLWWPEGFAGDQTPFTPEGEVEDD